MTHHQLVFQKTGNAMPMDRKIKNLLLGYFPSSDRKRMWIEVKKYCDEFSLSPTLLENSNFSQFSVGQQRRIMLIRALLLLDKNGGGCLFIDEAMRGMDISLKWKLIQYLNRKPHQVFLISHDKQLRHALCHKELRIKKNDKETIFELEDIKEEK